MSLALFVRRVAVTTIAALILAGLVLVAPASSVRAAGDSNIPGVPLPTSPVTGSLGGPIYDHVYSVDVPPASIILLSLTGEPGTDFDLYLFDSTATSVYIADGQVAFSTSTTSTESISYPTIAGGRYYIDLNGASDVEGQFRLVVSIQRDTAAPVAALRLNGGARATSDSTVQVNLIGTDDLSGVGGMQLSLDGQTWGAFVEYTPTFLWVFAGGDGQKELWARVRDRAGNVSAPATAKITLDRVAPSVLARDPEPGGTAAGLRPTISVTFSEVIDEQTWLNKGLIVQHANGDIVAGTYAWDGATHTGTFAPTTPVVAGEPLACSLSGITDLAGNPLAPPGTWIITPLQVHTITAAAVPAVVSAGSHATISGLVDGPVYGQMSLEGDSGGGWQRLEAVYPTSDGTYSASVVVQQNTQYRVIAAASQVEAPSTSPPIRILARRGLSLVGVGASTASRARVANPVRLTAALTPTLPSVQVALTITRYDATRRAWVASATLHATSTTAGRATFAWRPARTGSYRLRLTTPSSTSLANGISILYGWTVI